MKKYLEPDCQVLIMKMDSIICASPGFDAINATEEFTIDIEELI